MLNWVKLTAFGHRIIALIAAFFLVSTGLQANAAAVSPVYTIDDTGSFINITGGEKFNISLRDGGSYAWELRSYDVSIISIEEDRLWNDNPDPEQMGGGYTHNWTFEGKQKGNTTIAFVYWAYWAGNASIKNNFTLCVNVTSDAPMNPFWIYVIVLSVIIVVPTAVIMKWMNPKENEKG